MDGSTPIETREGFWRKLLFPDPPRAFKGRRLVKVLARALHVLCAGVMVGSYLLPADAALQQAWLVATVATGFGLLLIDLHESGAFLLQVRGMVVLGKLGVVAVLPALGSASGYVLAAVVLLAVVASHAPSSVRYFVVFGRGRVRGACSKG